MKSTRKALIVFMRYPQAGEVKSRLSARIGEERAARIYEKLLRRTLGVVSDFKRQNPHVAIFISFTPFERECQIKASFPGPWAFQLQEGKHLGQRMECAIRNVMSQGYESVLLAGTDIADQTCSDFSDAFEALEHGCAVLGPANDGGFYLIGLSRPCPSLFEPQQWGTDQVLQRTELLLSRAGFDVFHLQTRVDIDRPEDLIHLETDSFFADQLSIIVPTLRPIGEIQPFLSHLELQIWPGDEVIVVQGGRGRGDEVGWISERIRTTTSPTGRGHQLNAGTVAAKGNLLLFLHDDNLAPPNFAYSVRKIQSAPSASIGCFQLEFNPSSVLLGLVAKWANFRTRYFKLPYGDQGIFCRRHTFDAVGGFARHYLMEDVDFVNRCKKLGDLMILPDMTCTSPERYQKKGILLASMQNHMTMLFYLLGVHDKTLHSLYYRERSNPER